jgi:hypothetical protein
MISKIVNTNYQISNKALSAMVAFCPEVITGYIE